MTNESDADRILQERERRRSLERERIEEARRAREAELTRLEEFERRAASERGSRPAPKVVLRPVTLPGPETPAPATSSPPPTGARGDRDVGGRIVPPSVAAFLETDPIERFDLQVLNTFRLSGLAKSVENEPELLATLATRAEALMLRIKQEVDDPLSAGALLRDLVRRWYRESPTDPEWTRRTPERWGGLFADSRISGGRLQPWVNRRLYEFRSQAVGSGPVRLRLARALRRERSVELALARTPAQQIHAEVAQAILDDLASHPHDGEAAVPLVRLSELAVRRQVATVNDTHALLFNAPESGPFVILHPNRYPDCDELVLRPPSPGSTGAALAYSLVPGKLARKGPGRGRAGGESDAERVRPDLTAEPLAENVEVDASTVWQAEAVEPGGWRKVLEELRRERRRLESPPKDYRARAPYGALRELLLSDASARRTFLAVRWRGRPAGLSILVQLLQKGTLVPEVSTDHEYLEAELGELAQGDPAWSPPDGRWTVPGWTVVREGGHHEGFRFRAEPAD